jgi:hypothetical protein
VREARREADAAREREERERPTQPPSDPGGSQVPDPAPVAGVRVRDCPGAARVSLAELRAGAVALGYKPTGTMLFCAGSMVNFRCEGPGGNGITVESGATEGSIVPLRFDSGSALDAYVNGEKSSGNGGITLGVGKRAVLRIELPDADADRLLDRVCR